MFWWIAVCVVILVIATKTLYDAHSERIALQQEKLQFKDLVEKEKEISSKEIALAERERVISQQEHIIKSVGARAQWASKVLNDVTERERIVAEKEQALSDKNAFVAAAVKQATEKAEKAITKREQNIAIRENSIASRERSSNYLISAKWKEVDEREKLINERQSILLSNLTALPYMAGIIADYDTRGLEILARKLDWGFNQEREKKVASIRALRKETQKLLAQSKEAEYQLAYAIKMFPALEDFLETEYAQLTTVDFSDISSDNHDTVRSYLSAEEYSQLTPVQRNQLALDRYKQSHRKTNWQIGRDYEHCVGYRYSKKGYTVDYYGANNGLEDLGRDLIARKDGSPTLIIQCKYWSSKKTIHEKHINQLFGTMTCYCFENNIPAKEVRGVLVTNIGVSDVARRFAKYLGIELVENYPLGDYPCIKCNINYDEYGAITKIYHLPFDQQYDACKIDKPGEFFAATVAEAEAAGFRRAFKWYAGE